MVRMFYPPALCELCDEALDPNPPRLMLLLPIARLPLRAGLSELEVLLPPLPQRLPAYIGPQKKPPPECVRPDPAEAGADSHLVSSPQSLTQSCLLAYTSRCPFWPQAASAAAPIRTSVMRDDRLRVRVSMKASVGRAMRQRQAREGAGAES